MAKNLPVEVVHQDDQLGKLDLVLCRLADMVAQRITDSKPVKSVTLQELFESYMSLHVRLKCKTWRNFERMYASYLSQWSERQVSEISRLEVQQLFANLADTAGKTTANRVVQFLRPMFNHGIKAGLIDCPNPVEKMEVFRLQTRERFLEQEEIERLFEAIESLRYSTTRDFLQLCLFTGARRGNVMAMRWDQISFERKTWSIPITKNGTSQLLPLTDLAVDVLKRRKQQANESNQWVFPSDRSISGHLTKPEGAWQMILERAGLENVRIHDLRRTLASWQALTGANISTIAATLNHKDLKSTAIYARLNTDAVRTAMNTAVHAMTGQASPAASPGRPSEKPGSDQNKCDLSPKTLTD